MWVYVSNIVNEGNLIGPKGDSGIDGNTGEKGNAGEKGDLGIKCSKHYFIFLLYWRTTKKI